MTEISCVVEMGYRLRGPQSLYKPWLGDGEWMIGLRYFALQWQLGSYFNSCAITWGRSGCDFQTNLTPASWITESLLP